MLDPVFLAPHAVARWAAATPDSIATQHVDGRTVTYDQLNSRALEWAAALQRAGVQRGAHVATMLPIGFDAQVAMLALGWLRVIEVPINTAYRGKILHYALAHADVTVLLIATEFLDRLADVGRDLPLLETVIVADGPAGPTGADRRVIGRADLFDGLDPALEPQFDGPTYRDIAALLYTSGTTGPSKAVIAPWGLIYQFWSFVPDDTLVPGAGIFIPFPLFHNSGRSGFNYAMACGARFIFRERFDATTFWDDVRVTNARVAALVGPLTSLLYSAPPAPTDGDNPLESVVVGPMIPEMTDFERRFGVRVCTSYGQTEIGCPFATPWDHGPWATCGRPRTDYPWPEVRIVNDYDEPVGADVVGELVLRSPEPWSLNVGYYKDAEQTVDAWRNGWFHTGDAMKFDRDGWYYFVDRLRDSIRRRGENISSFEIENIVGEHPQVIECAAVGIRTPLGDDEVLAALIVRDEASFDPAEFVEFLESRLPKFMLPRYVEVFDDFPRNETSMRVRKTDLRARGLSARTWDRESAVRP